MPRTPVLAVLSLLAPCLPAVSCHAQAPEAHEGRNHSAAVDAMVRSLPDFVPEKAPAGTIRLWGHGSFSRPFMRLLVARWVSGFHRYEPDIQLVEDTYGTSSAIPAIALGAGDLAILGEEILPEAVDTFTRIKGYPPACVQVATGSVDVRNMDYAQMFFVQKDNPLTHLSLPQLDAIFGEEHRRGPATIRTWGELGLTGDWAKRPIVPYGWRSDDSFGIYLEETLLKGSHRWNPALHEYAHIPQPDGSIYDHGQQVLDHLALDRYGIGVSNIRYAGPDVKALEISETDSSTPVPATADTLVNQTYPLTRLLPAFYDRPPGKPVDPKVREFLRYILSRQGQQDILDDQRYLPLNPRAIAQQLEALQ